MNDNLPPLPIPDKQGCEDDPMYGILPVDYYTAEQMQAYARAAIECQSVQDARVIECAQRLVQHADFQLGGALSADSKPKEIPSNAASKVKARHLAALRDAIAAAPQPQPVAWLVTGPSEKRSFDMQSFAESWCKGLNKGFGEDVYKISNLVVQSSEPHEKCNDERMCAACYSGQSKCKTQPVQQEQCPECDGTGTVAGSQAHFPCPICTSPQEAQPLSNEQITKLPVWRHFVGLMPEHHVEITRAIEQAHGIKGTT